MDILWYTLPSTRLDQRFWWLRKSTFCSIKVTEFDPRPTTPKSQSHHPFGFPSPTLRPSLNRSYFSQCLVYLLVFRECDDDYFQAPQAVRRCRGSVIANHSSFVDQFLVNIEFSPVCDRSRPNMDKLERCQKPVSSHTQSPCPSGKFTNTVLIYACWRNLVTVIHGLSPLFQIIPAPTRERFS
jgi:hypothetical protein